MTEQQARFDGWAVVDVLGHQRYVGYVTTEAYGQAVLFRIDVPALPARERVTKRPGHYSGHGWLPPGTTVTEGAVEGYTKLIGAGSIYAITPCTEAAAMAAVEEMQPRPLMTVTLPEHAQLAAPNPLDMSHLEGEQDDLGEDDGDDEDWEDDTVRKMET